MAAQSQQQNSDNSLAILWGVLLIFAVSWLLWHFFHDSIARFLLALRLYEVKCIAWVIPSTQMWVIKMQGLRSHNLSFSDLIEISRITGHYLRFPISLILLGFAFLIYRNRATLRFKNTYSMQFLAESETQNWVQITPAIKLDLVNTDINKGAWAMAATPVQFALQHHLLQLETIPPAVSTAVTIIGGNYVQAKLKREAAKNVFIMQLGSLWQGVDSLSLQAQALFAIFAARAVRDRASADQLMAQISKSARSLHYEKSSHLVHHLNFSGVKTLLKKYAQSPLVMQILKKHAYVLSVMASMLVLAREDGVLSSSEFLWLKPCDRTLWFMLNCVGRQTAYVEVAGPFAHWIAERTLARRLRVPMVDTAVEALEIAVKEVRLSEKNMA